MIMQRLLVMFAIAACGPKAAPPPPIPVLPGDGDTHVVKPPPVKPPASSSSNA